MKIGAHVSIEGGLERSIARAQKLGADCLQIFASPPRSWKAPAHSAESIERFRRGRAEARVDPAFLHSIYLLNLASDDELLWIRSVGSLTTYLQLASSLGAGGVVTHLGSRGGASEEESETRVWLALKKSMAEASNDVPVLLETSAGAGNSVGSSFESLGRIMRYLDLTPLVQMCLDTAHVFAAGYDVASEEGLDRTLAKLDEEVGLDRLKLIHINDSKAPLGARVDRHENIGQGKIGVEAFARILRHPRLRHLPFIMEVPGIARQGPVARDVAQLRQLASPPEG